MFKNTTKLPISQTTDSGKRVWSTQDDLNQGYPDSNPIRTDVLSEQERKVWGAGGDD